MRKILIGSVAAGVLLGGGAGVAAVFAADRPPVEMSVFAAPVFPEARAVKAVEADVVPPGAQYRVASGKRFKYVACDRQRAFAGGHVELGCLTFSKTKGWGKSIRWYPKYQLLALDGAAPAEPVVTAIR